MTATRSLFATPGLASVTTVVVHDELVRGRLKPLVMYDDGAPVRYVRQSEAERDDIDADFWVCPQRPSAADRRVLFETTNGALVEQDDRGRIFIDGEAQFGDPLVAFGCAREGRQSALCIGASVVLVLAQRVDAGWHIRVGRTAPVLWLFDQPRCAPTAGAFDHFLWIARDLPVARRPVA